MPDPPAFFIRNLTSIVSEIELGEVDVQVLLPRPGDRRRSSHASAPRSPPSDSARTYILVFLALIALTVITTAVAFVDLGDFSVVAALAIAVGKVLLVSLLFMHVRHSTKLTKLVLVGAIVWLGILIVLTLTDFMTCGFTGIPGR